MGGARDHGNHGGHAHAALMAVRLLLRDEHFQHLLMRGVVGGAGGGASLIEGGASLEALRKLLANLVSVHFSSTPPSVQHTTDLLKEVTSESGGRGDAR